MKKFSKNKKLNGVLNDILEDLESLGLEEVKRFYNEFKNESDYNIAQYGSCRIYYDDIRQMYKDNGYKIVDRFSDMKLWETYKRQVGYVASLYVSNEFNYIEEVV